jgi:hypothetical protein
MKSTTLTSLVAVTMMCQCVQAAFVVEPISGGKAFDHYAWAGGAGGVASVTALGGTAPGLSGINSSIFGGSVSPDIYRFSYTPGTDVDNTTFAADDPLGDNFGVANLASGLVGGGSGLYNVYATWPVSSNVGPVPADPNVNFLVSSDGPLLTTPAINQNTGLSGTPGGNEGWFLLGTVSLTAGNTYTVDMDAITDNFVSMRSAGVMWEAAPVPEPSMVALSVIGGLGLLFALRRRV